MRGECLQDIRARDVCGRRMSSRHSGSGDSVTADVFKTFGLGGLCEGRMFSRHSGSGGSVEGECLQGIREVL